MGKGVKVNRCYPCRFYGAFQFRIQIWCLGAARVSFSPGIGISHFFHLQVKTQLFLLQPHQTPHGASNPAVAFLSLFLLPSKQ